jgi:hypothetical protein
MSHNSNILEANYETSVVTFEISQEGWRKFNFGNIMVTRWPLKTREEVQPPIHGTIVKNTACTSFAWSGGPMEDRGEAWTCENIKIGYAKSAKGFCATKLTQKCRKGGFLHVKARNMAADLKIVTQTLSEPVSKGYLARSLMSSRVEVPHSRHRQSSGMQMAPSTNSRYKSWTRPYTVVSM